MFKYFHGSLTTVVMAQNDTSKTANNNWYRFSIEKVITLRSKSRKCQLLHIQLTVSLSVVTIVLSCISSDILADIRNFFIPPLHSTHPFGQSLFQYF